MCFVFILEAMARRSLYSLTARGGGAEPVGCR